MFEIFTDLWLISLAYLLFELITLGSKEEKEDD